MSDIRKYCTPTQLKYLEAYEEYGSIRKAANKLGVDQSTLGKALSAARKKAQITPKVADEITLEEEHRLKREAKMLKAQAKELEQQIVQDRETAELLRSLSPRIEIPKWLTPKKSKDDQAIACCMLSDLHYGETVNPHEIDFVNAYNLEIAEQRTKECFSNIIKLSRDHIGGVDYQGCVVFLGGDIVSGRIHEELRRTNEPESILEQAAFATNVLGAGISQLLEHFDKVHVACVVGNHGRLDREKAAKGYVKDSIDRLIYSQLRKNLPDATWQIPESRDCIVTVNGSRYLMTHGDQFRGGSGISGIMTPLKLGAARKRQNANFDYMILGHFHQLIDMGDIIVNGSLKGWDEFAASFNFASEPPKQAFWLDQKGYGKTISAPIHCSAPDEDWGVFKEAIGWG